MNNTIKYSISERQNLAHPEEPKKAYAFIQHQKTLTLPEMAKHIVKHGSPFSSGAIQGILVDLTDCIGEALTEGNNVGLGDLGILRTTITSEGSLPGVDRDGNPKTAAEMFTAANIKSLNVNFETSDELAETLGKAEFEPTITRRAQAAALRAQKAGQSSADWSGEEQNGEG